MAKSFDSRARFESECQQLRAFAGRGFLVPRLVSADSERMIVFTEHIEGVQPERFRVCEMEACVAVLARIGTSFGIQESRDLAAHYCDGVRRRIVEMAYANACVIEEAAMDRALAHLEDTFEASLFKDAKPSNWIFTQSGPAMIDFDYVCPSFVLADLAQFLTYVALGQEVDYDFWLERFLRQLSGGFRSVVKMQMPFRLAMINSNSASLEYNPRIPAAARAALNQQSVQFMEILQVVRRGEDDAPR